MKVVHIITRMIVGGAQENTLFNCRDLANDYGDEVVLVTGPSTGPEGDLMQTLGVGDVATHLVPSLIRPIHPLSDWRAYRELRRYLQQQKPDVVHTHSAKGGFLGRLAAHSVGVPAIIHTVHGAPFHPYQNFAIRKLYQSCERFAAARCHKLICVADAMTDLLTEARVCRREQCVTIYSGMDVQPFLDAARYRDAVRAEFGFADDDLVIGKIARLFHLKGHEYVLEAAAPLLRANRNVRLLLVGDGLLRSQLERMAQSLEIQRQVVFAGLVPPRRIPEMLSAMDLLVHASLREGLARALPQALLAGIPAISFDVDGAREVVIDGKTGRLTPPKDCRALRGALEDLIESPEDRERMGRAGRELCVRRFPHQEMTRQIRSLYESVLSRV